MAKNGLRNLGGSRTWARAGSVNPALFEGFAAVLAEKPAQRAVPATGRAPELLALLRGRLEVRVGRPLDGDVGDLPLAALEDRNEFAVEAVDVVAELQLAGLVHERGLVHEVDWDLIDEVELLLLAAEHPLDAFCGVVRLRRRIGQQHLGVFQRILHALAAVTVSALVMVEVVL